MVNDAEAIVEASAKIRPEDLSLDSHQRIFRAILLTVYEGISVDINTLSIALRKRKELDSVGGIGYVMGLTEGIPRNFRVENYVRIVKDASRKRQGIAENAIASEALQDGGEDTTAVLERTVDRLKSLIEDDDDFDLQHVGDYFDEMGGFDEMQERMVTTQGVNSGIAEFDRITMGYQPKGLSIIAARPKMGKTAKMICNAYNAAVVERKVVAIFSHEQDKNDVMRRMLSAFARVDYARIKAGTLGIWEKDALRDCQARIADSRLFITDQPGPTVSRIRATCARKKREEGRLDIAFIDQLSRLKFTDVYRKGMPKHEIIGEQTDRLVLASQELNTSIVLLAQLRRYDGKGDTRPTLEMLKDSGDIEEDATLVELLHRPRYYDSNSGDDDEIIIAAQREGETGTVKCFYRGSIMRWEGIADKSETQSSMDDYYRP